MVKIVNNLSTDNKRNILFTTESSEIFLCATVFDSDIFSKADDMELIREQFSARRKRYRKIRQFLTIAFVYGCVYMKMKTIVYHVVK